MVRGKFSLLAMWWCLSPFHAAEITAFPLNKPGEGAIIIDGDIVARDREDFLTKIIPFSGGVVIFNSKGGSAYAGIEIGKAIRMRNFSTWVPSGSHCASACAIAWLGGTRRLMGKTALIGFHTVYQLNNGVPVETGMGNAMFGAYLSQLGLSDRAIMYLSSAAPTSMNWLTSSDAENFGIELTVFDAQPSAPKIADLPRDSESLEVRSRNFVVALNVLISGPSEKFIPLLNGLYAERVAYFGKGISRAEVNVQIENFIKRWPIRAYSARPESVNVRCDEVTLKCKVEGVIDFDAKNNERNQRSHGAATFEYLLEFRPNSRWPVIVGENGKVVTRELDVLRQRLESPYSDFVVR